MTKISDDLKELQERVTRLELAAFEISAKERLSRNQHYLATEYAKEERTRQQYFRKENIIMNDALKD